MKHPHKSLFTFTDYAILNACIISKTVHRLSLILGNSKDDARFHVRKLLLCGMVEITSPMMGYCTTEEGKILLQAIKKGLEGGVFDIVKAKSI